MCEYEYGNLIYNDIKGWRFIKKNKTEDLKSETLVSSLDYLGKKGWDLVVYEEKVGYILQLKKEKGQKETGTKKTK